MPRALLLAALALTGCDRNSPGVDDAKVTTEMLERVAGQRNVVQDIGAAARLQPLGAVGAFGEGAPCRFTRDGALLFIAGSQAGAARINGANRNLRAEGPVGATGGFFRDREIGVSIGAVQGGVARIIVTNRLTEAREEARGTWSCAAPAR